MQPMFSKKAIKTRSKIQIPSKAAIFKHQTRRSNLVEIQVVKRKKKLLLRKAKRMLSSYKPYSMLSQRT